MWLGEMAAMERGMVKAASWSDFGTAAAYGGAASEAMFAATTEAGSGTEGKSSAAATEFVAESSAAATEFVAANKVKSSSVSTEIGAAKGKPSAVAAEAGAENKSAAGTRTMRFKVCEEYIAALKAGVPPQDRRQFQVPSEELMEDFEPEERERMIARYTKFAALIKQWDENDARILRDHKEYGYACDEVEIED
ncbi:hypothetical protein BS78_09G022800 [Paspalum vaginatum]|nr:hypothetical protein BS78_09G022800 [Paspalum vaginatum]